MLEKTVRMNALFDFYHHLLTEKQQKYLELYFLDDYSLGEIADTYDVSRQAVYDNIKRTEMMLEEYEKKLGLYYRYRERLQVYQDMRKLLGEDSVELLRMLERLEQLEEEGQKEWHLKV
ncbi:putative DNA-binding protein [Salsuginibacillus kocurii]|uniref:putative DNA-binding protein n=1 Tax=Salsuginibacillus kocurii TaxID=427078 RepID=UPI00037EACCE|nr:putative DNA-binding protein [Salsuginibacillus kocurii]